MIEEEKESVRREMKEYRRSFTLSEKRRKDEIIFKKVTKNKRVIAGKKDRNISFKRRRDRYKEDNNSTFIYG